MRRLPFCLHERTSERMNPHTNKSIRHGALLGLLSLAVFGTTACTNTTGEAVGESQSALINIGPGGPGSGGGIGIGGGGGGRTLPVFPPTAFQASTTTSNTVTLTWNEHGGNGETILYRQLYDIAGNASGGLEPIATWSGSSAGPMTYTDQNPTLVISPRPIRTAAGFGIAAAPIQPDRQIGYQVVEVLSGYTSCENIPGGNTCAYSPTTVAYTQGSVPYGVGRAQLRIQVSDATANASSLHLRAQLSPFNTTWLDSTANNFAVGSDITYDLETDALGSRSDINYIDLWSPDNDGICVSDIALKIDNTTTFHQSFATCQWVGKAGEELNVPFAALRSSAAWQAYTPYLFVPSTLLAPVTFVGYDSAGLISYLDASVGSALKNAVPAPPNGFNATLGAPTTISRTDKAHLHVQQHLVNLEVYWDGTDFGTVNADPSYDLVIHHDDSVCPATWCVDVENVSGNASTLWVGAILELFSSVALPIIMHEINDHIQSSLTSLSGLPDPKGNGYCFVPAAADISNTNPSSVFGSYRDDGTAVPFDEGSLTVCPES
jgi:hypothetical protein